ncbi:MAG: glucosamine-6-phosphate deaminase [Victivallales bacterium]|nr:glucosamine-6-phosphate deaminase [Victivallales bacterium]
MKVIILPNDKAVAKYAYQLVKDRIDLGINAIGLPAGETPLKLYAEIAKGFKRGELDFSGVRAFCTHEYLGVSENDDRSCRRFLDDNLFCNININPDWIYSPNAMAEDFVTECQNYEDDMDYLGGVKLQILDIGRNGRVAYNEPGCSLNCRAGLVAFSKETQDELRPYFPKDESIPKFALSIGIGTIMDADECLVLATGSEKADAVAAMVEGPVSTSCPASALQYHNTCIVVIDDAAAANLKRIDFYKATVNAEEQAYQYLMNERKLNGID